MDNTFSKDNILIVAAKDDGSKKNNNGYNSILALLKDLSTFQTSVGACMEEQTDPANQAKVEEFYKYLDKMSETLLVMAADGLRSTRRQRQGMGGEEGVEMAPQEAPSVEEAPIMGGDRSVSRVQSPTAPTMGM